MDDPRPFPDERTPAGAFGRSSVLRRALRAIALAAVLTVAGMSSAARADGSPPRITLSAPAVETGGTLAAEIDCRPVNGASREVQLAFAGQRIALFPHPVKGGGTCVGLVAVALNAPAGTGTLDLGWTDSGRSRSRRVDFRIVAGAYGEERLSVDPRHVRPSPADLERIRREQEKLKQVYAAGSPERLWSRGFALPVPGEVNGAFGTRRVFNGELRSQHSGVDFRAAAGDPVQASSSGVVRLAEELFYSGNAVIIDHGAGVFTSYSHLSRIDVAVGRRVEKGEVIGLIGATGRATGPHLHWGVKVNAVTVNPLSFQQLMTALTGG
ncbi:MAG: M23 family metallopeptidase [Desulfobacterales bacterium]|nr:M23 family metallopeptidase [Desulfobacterales bacterium]